MPCYSCKSCNFDTAIKNQYEKHLLTKKHIANNVCSEESISDLDNMKQTIVDQGKSIEALQTALLECKQLIMDMKTNAPTPTPPQPPSPQPPSPQPQNIIIQTSEPTVKKETCNPVYHCKELDENEKLKSIQGVDTYFKIAGDVQFEFEDLEIETDIRVINKDWVMKKLTSFVAKNKENIPFRYYKSSLYFKNEQGSWEREIPPVNKGEKLSNGTYKHNLLVKKFIFIIRNRTIKHLDEQLGDNWRLRNFEDLYGLMENETFDRDCWRNAELVNQLQDLLI